jgi:hypothetical protein
VSIGYEYLKTTDVDAARHDVTKVASNNSRLSAVGVSTGYEYVNTADVDADAGVSGSGSGSGSGLGLELSQRPATGRDATQNTYIMTDI